MIVKGVSGKSVFFLIESPIELPIEIRSLVALFHFSALLFGSVVSACVCVSEPLCPKGLCHVTSAEGFCLPYA